MLNQNLKIMERKKSLKADLESKKSAFFLVGLVLSLIFVLMAFEWGVKPQKAILQGGTTVDYVEDVLPPLIREPKPQLPTPLKQIPVDVITIVDNATDVKDPIIEDSSPVDYLPIDLTEITRALPTEKTEQIFVNTVEVPAEFPGGERALYRFISEHVKYPLIAQENGVEGKVFVNFVVDEQGNAIDIKIGRPGDASLDAEALRVISSLPRFKPARQGGKAVKVYYTAVINFQLQ